ncbi:MAG: VWA domain-containing protein [Bradymonadaceae bacterium]|nr:VWA domain-containing protein [Lujinxingiaceae bacterium]
MKSLFPALLVVLVLASCTDARLQRLEGDPLPEYDNKLRLEGEFCTEPSGQVVFPIKVLFILDQSNSLQCLDSENRRFAALNSALRTLRSAPQTQFAFVGFSSWVRQQNFTRNLDDVAQFLDPAGGLGPATDYQGALATALRLIEQDIVATDAMERARTRYIINFVSDGVPEPRCTAGCDSSRPPDSLYGVCNTTRDIPEGEYVELTPCQPYNQPQQIVRRVEELLALKDIYSVGDITLNSVLLFSPQEIVEGICPGAAAQFGYDRVEAQAALLAMANAGNGVFRDINLAQSGDDFLRVDVSSVKADYGLATMIAHNENARRTPRGLEPDSDGDGLADALEHELGTDPYNRDTDGDGYSDFFEHHFRREGFDPKRSSAPAISCSDRRDRDGDGLAECEEAYLGTSPTNPDTDGDGVPDGLEFVLGTNPLLADGFMDPDFDGVINIDEIRAGTNPLHADEDVYREQRMLYNLTDLGLKQFENQNGRTEDRRCYRFDISRVPLAVTTLPRERGRNRVLIHTRERLSRMGGITGISRVACFEAVYNEGRMKNPSSGVIDVSQKALDHAHATLAQKLGALADCPYFALAEDEWFTRPDLERFINRCLPGKIQLGEQLFTRAQINELLDRNMDQDAELRLPTRAHELFVPLPSFREDRHCFRPWEFERVEELLNDMVDACMTCTPPE